LASPLFAAATPAAGNRIQVVAAENFYGDIARQVGGERVAVTSVLENPNQDPHLFETAPSVVRLVDGAQIVIENGGGYDPWMGKLVQAGPRPGRTVITVARLVDGRPGDNPHLWYDPATMPRVAEALADAFSKVDPTHAAGYAARLKTTLAALGRVQRRVDELRARYAGTAVTATEPVFGCMAEALGLRLRNERFQVSVMNDTEPSARDLGRFEEDLRQHRVKALIYNRQVSDRLTRQLLGIARESGVPVVPVTETQPQGLSYSDWMLGELDALAAALESRPP
jgi:zinc/manganese transport system substrate-binding protein